MEPKRKERETNGTLGSSQEAPPASSGQLLAHQQEPRKPRFSRRALAVAGVSTLGALIVGRQAGILATNEEKLSIIHISEPTRPCTRSRMTASA